MDDEYLVPANVSSGFEIVEGIGMKEALTLAVIAACGASLMILFRMVFTIPIHYAAIGFIFCPVLCGYFITKRGPHGPSMLSLMKAMIKYLKAQRKFLYKITRL